MLKFLLFLLGAVGAMYVGLCGLLYAQQRSFIYYPTPESDSRRADALWLDNDGERIKVWHVARPGTSAIIYFGGNAEDVSLSIDEFAQLFPAQSIYLVNYRGYGGSTGQPTEAALKSDALAVYDRVAQSSDSVAVISRSLGTVIGMFLSTERPVSRLVLITPFDSVENIARRAFPIFPVSALLKDRYNSLDYVDRLDLPVLVLLAERDGVIPEENSRALVAAIASKDVAVEVIGNTSHNSIDASPAFGRALGGFI